MGRLTDRIRKEKLFICCEAFIFLSLILLSAASSYLMISALALILGFFSKGTVPITSTMIAESSSADGYESAYSLNSLSTSIASTTAPLLLGFAADAAGIQSVFTICGLVALLSIIPAAMLIHVTQSPE